MTAPEASCLTELMDARRRKYMVNRRFPEGWYAFSARSLATHLALIFLLSAAVQLLAGWLVLFRHSVPLLDMDEQEYWGLAGKMMDGLPFEVGRRTIGFPLVLAGLRSVTNNLLLVQSAVAVLAATAAPLLALVVRKLTQSQSAAILAGVGFALWPAQIFFGASLYSETLALPVFLLFLAILPFSPAAHSTGKWWSWVLAGAILGCTAHVRPMYELFLPVLAFVLWLDVRRLQAAASRFMLVLAGFAVVVLPWSIYASQKLGHPTLLTANGGETFAGGFNPALLKTGERLARFGNRTSWYGPGKWVPVPDNGYLSTSEQSLPYAQQDRLMRQRAMNWILSNPRDAAYLAWRKISYMWGIYPFALNGWAQATLGNALTLALLVLFLAALVDDTRVRRRCARLYMLPLFVTGVGLISWGSWRFRLPADAGMVGVIAIWLSAKAASFRHSLDGEVEF